MKLKCFFFSCLFLAAMVMQGCVAALDRTPVSTPSTQELAPEEFASHINVLREKTTSPNPMTPETIRENHRELARLYLSPKNPHRNTIQAASELEIFMANNPKGKDRDEAENILLILQEIHQQENQIEKLQKDLHEIRAAKKSTEQKDSLIQKLTNDIESLRTKQKELQTENNKLEMTIEKLRFLDLNMEKKRKTFR